MSVSLWWRERLEARRPIGSDSLWVEGLTYRPRIGGGWPHAVARQPMMLDYVEWYNKNCAAGNDVMGQLEFFCSLAPFVYIVSRRKQIRSYWTKEQKMFEGEWVTVKKRHYFIRLSPWEDHVRVFEENSGHKVRLHKPSKGSMEYT